MLTSTTAAEIQAHVEVTGQQKEANSRGTLPARFVNSQTSTTFAALAPSHIEPYHTEAVAIQPAFRPEESQPVNTITVGTELFQDELLSESLLQPPFSRTSPDPQQSAKPTMIEMYIRALRAKEKAWGPDSPTTLDTAADLGRLYASEGSLNEAREMYSRALSGYERVCGKEDPKTQEIAHSLNELRARTNLDG